MPDDLEYAALITGCPGMIIGLTLACVFARRARRGWATAGPLLPRRRWRSALWGLGLWLAGSAFMPLALIGTSSVLTGVMHTPQIDYFALARYFVLTLMLSSLVVWLHEAFAHEPARLPPTPRH